jgi:N-acylneuraminate cytidylyltransferase/CMP-N,N'-diacetyllegionaminic acid synthase
MSPSPYVLGAVCGRGGSRGVPRKNLRRLAGKPLIGHAIECARACPALAEVVASTDDPEIAETARRYGAVVPKLRPAHLAQDDSSKWLVFRDLVETWEAIAGRRIDALVDLDTGVPQRLPEDVTACVRALLASGADVVVTAYEAERNPYFNMVELDPEGRAAVVKPLAAPITCRQAAPRVYSLSGSVFAIRRDALWEFEHWSRSTMRIHEVPRERAVDVDSELDLRLVEFLLQRAGRAEALRPVRRAALEGCR